MASIFKIFNIARMALSSQQVALTVASHNIANANTEGFSRQKVTFNTATPDLTGVGFLGSGVAIGSIERVRDSFLGVRISSELEIFGKLEQESKILKQLEVVFNEAGDTGLNNAINNFFESWSSLASDASAEAERSGLMDSAKTMVSSFNKMNSDMTRLRRDTNTKVRNVITEINSMTSQIADLNNQIHQTELGSTKANDLRDTRDLLVKELSRKININFFEDANNIVNIVTSNGYSLVENLNAFNLSTSPNANDPSVDNILWENQSGSTSNITSILTEGELAGLINLRDNTILDSIRKLGAVAASIINEVNLQHSAGYALDGTSGINFFDPLGASVTADSLNTGSETVTASLRDPAALLRSDYEMTITSATTFTLQNTTMNSASSTYTFASGTAVTLPEGLSVTITGTATVGDVFDISVNKDAGRDIAINSAILSNTGKIAASKGGSRSDGDNAKAIFDLKNTSLMSPSTITSGTFTFTIQEFYTSVVSQIGSSTRRVSNNLSQQSGIINQLENLKESISGVSVDEEMLNVIQFQRAYEASAKMINVVDEMLDTIINRL